MGEARRRLVRVKGRNVKRAKGVCGHAWSLTFWAAREADGMASTAERYGLDRAAKTCRAWERGWLAACAGW